MREQEREREGGGRSMLEQEYECEAGFQRQAAKWLLHLLFSCQSSSQNKSRAPADQSDQN